jgi:hypothetical protein
VAVGAKHPKILYAMVVRDPVSVIELDGQGLALPRVQTALLTDVLEYTSLDQASLDGASALGFAENLLKRPALSSRAKRAAPRGFRPRKGREAEPFATLAKRSPWS